MDIINADDPYTLIGHLHFEDIIIFTCQCMWHLKDWILNDSEFGAKSLADMKAEIHNERCLLVCSDLANGTKHLKLNYPKTGSDFADGNGIHIDTKLKIFKRFYYIVTQDKNDPYNLKEIRELLNECRAVWNRIINKHYLSKIEL